jgi:hypothetical protein
MTQLANEKELEKARESSVELLDREARLQLLKDNLNEIKRRVEIRHEQLRQV